MTQEKMKAINAWAQRIDKNRMDVQDQMVIANATVRMLEEIEPIYDKYAGGEKKGRHKGEFYR